MGIGGLEKNIVASMLEHPLPSHQQSLLNEILACSNPSSLASGSVNICNTLVVALASLIGSMKSFGVSGQPDSFRLRILRNAATKACASLIALKPSDPSLLNIEAQLRNIPDAAFMQTLDRQAMKTVASHLQVEVESFPALVERLMDLAWAATAGFTLSNDQILSVAQEIAAMRSYHDGSYADLLSAVEKVVESPNSKERRRRLVHLISSDFKVVVGVKGARRFDGLDGFLENAEQFREGQEDSVKWGSRTGILQEFTKRASDDGAKVFLQLRIKAVDGSAAASAGRQEVSEVLDQYVAGHRLVDLRMTESVAVLDCKRHSASHRSFRRPAVEVAHPLTSTWPDNMRESLRSGHLAVRSESPLTQIVLAWSALEAAGLQPDDLPKLVSALTLQTLRHQVNEVYLCMYQSVTAGAESSLRGLKTTEHYYEGLLERIRTLTNPDAISSLTERSKAASLKLKRYEVETERQAEKLLPLLDDIQQYVEVDARGYPTSINTWADLLYPRVTEPGVHLSRAYYSLRLLQKELKGMPLSRLESWRHRFSDASSFADWRQDMESQFEYSLHRLYSARNIAVHTGAVSIEGDRMLANAGIALVDLLHEVLGNWNRVCRDYTLVEKLQMTPKLIVAELAERLDLVASVIDQDKHEYINLDHVTSPTSNSIDRKKENRNGNVVPLDQT